MPVTVNKDLCLGCGACTGVCPTESLKIEDDGKCGCNQDTCIDCCACVATCPAEAINQ